MRILTVAFLAGSAVVAASSFSSKVSEVETQSSQRASVEVPDTIDPIVTGQTISSEKISDWELQSKRYQECPECEELQPFPDD